VVVGMAFQQAIITELTFRRSYLQGSFSTDHDFKYRLSVGYDFRAGLTAGNDFRARLSAGHDCKADLIKISVCRNDLTEGHNFRTGFYNKLLL
jgi:hypothetical protein